MSGSYTVQPWNPLQSGATPITDTALDHMETGIGLAHDRIDALSVGSVLIPVTTQLSGTVPVVGKLTPYDASAGVIGPVTLPVPVGGTLLGLVKADSGPNAVVFTSPSLLANGGSNSFTLRVLGETRTLYGTASGWVVTGVPAPIVGTVAGTVASGGDGRFANTMAATLFGGSSRSYAPFVEVRWPGASYNVTDADLFAQGSWVTNGADPDGMLTTNSGFQCINLPVAGRYQVHYHTACSVNAASDMYARVSLNQALVSSNSAAVGVQSPTASHPEVHIDAFSELNYQANDKLFWSNWNRYGVMTVYAAFYGQPTGLTVRYVGPRN